jgi:hypothetical protein
VNTTHPITQVRRPLPRLFRLTYSNASPDDDPRLYKARDCVAFCELSPVFYSFGYEFGTTVHLYPEDERPLSQFPAFRPADLLLLTTRPPLHDVKPDELYSSRKRIYPGKTGVEAALGPELLKFFSYCSRKHVILTDHGASFLGVPDALKWKHVEVYEYRNAEILCHHVPETLKPPVGRRSTIAFFLRVNQVPHIGCDFAASFAMDAYGTLIWNRIVRTRFPEWVKKPQFVMAEVVFKRDLPDMPLTPEFADDEDLIQVRVLTAAEPGAAPLRNGSLASPGSSQKK